MTDKSISQQICRLCEIKPKIIQDYELNDIEVYPNFENNNNNFCKLFELKLGKSDATIAGELNYYDRYYTDKKTFLETLYDFIHYERDGRVQKLYKDSIKNTDWEY